MTVKETCHARWASVILGVAEYRAAGCPGWHCDRPALLDDRSRNYSAAWFGHRLTSRELDGTRDHRDGRDRGGYPAPVPPLPLILDADRACPTPGPASNRIDATSVR